MDVDEGHAWEKVFQQLFGEHQIVYGMHAVLDGKRSHLRWSFLSCC